MKNKYYKGTLILLLVSSVSISGCFGTAMTKTTDATIASASKVTYPIVDTGQSFFYNNSHEVEDVIGTNFQYQDAWYAFNEPSYTNNGDGTISDNVTGLMWQRDAGDKVTLEEAYAIAEEAELAGYDDWRVPTIKELYSLMNFDGKTGRSLKTTLAYFDDDYFVFKSGNEAEGERFIDGQFLTSTLYESTTMHNDKTLFGVNFVDGRIKGYPVVSPKDKSYNTFFLLMVRGNETYGENNFIDNGDGTVSDLATGLMWLQEDSGCGMNWEEALIYANEASEADYTDWRLPDAKELQSIVDYSRSPDTTQSAAIDPVFHITSIKDEGDSDNYPFFWSSTTHLDGKLQGSTAVYLAFGEALGYMSTPRNSAKVLLDVHGAGAQRSDPKTGDASDYPEGMGPQGDVRRIDNFVRLVRNID